jgi:ribonuclease T1
VQIKGILYLLVILLVAAFAMDCTHNTSSNTSIANRKDTIPVKKSSEINKKPELEKSGQADIPDYVMNVLNHVLKYQEAPPEYTGGRIFQNREKRLRMTDNSGTRIKYQEWDVHPKIKGKNRGAERLITGSDHSAYYTRDHYQTFIKINP